MLFACTFDTTFKNHIYNEYEWQVRFIRERYSNVGLISEDV